LFLHREGFFQNEIYAFLWIEIIFITCRNYLKIFCENLHHFIDIFARKKFSLLLDARPMIKVSILCIIVQAKVTCLFHSDSKVKLEFHYKVASYSKKLNYLAILNLLIFCLQLSSLLCRNLSIKYNGVYRAYERSIFCEGPDNPERHQHRKNYLL
jgi:hypothetical protein